MYPTQAKKRLEWATVTGVATGIARGGARFSAGFVEGTGRCFCLIILKAILRGRCTPLKPKNGLNGPPSTVLRLVLREVEPGFLQASWKELGVLFAESSSKAIE
jgi:hypothetical protein